MDWNDLRYFLSVARSGSLTHAGEELHVSQSTVSRRISELEASFGMPLFARHQTGYYLTDEGREVLRHAEQVEDSVMALERSAAGLDKMPVGTVRLATSENLATDLLIPALPAFRRRYPGIALEIVTSTQTTELGRREADIALRTIRPSHGNLKVRQVGQMSYSLFAHRDYLDAHPAPAENPLEGCDFIVWDEAHAHLPAARWLARVVPDARISLVTSSLPAQIAAMKAGLGLAIIPDFLIIGPDFMKVRTPAEMFSNGLWLVAHADLTASARVRAVSDFIAGLFAQTSLALPGYP